MSSESSKRHELFTRLTASLALAVILILSLGPPAESRNFVTSGPLRPPASR